MSRRGLQSKRRYIARRHPIPDAAHAVLLEIGLAGRLVVRSLDPRYSDVRLLMRHHLVAGVDHSTWVLTETGQQLAVHLIHERFKK